MKNSLKIICAAALSLTVAAGPGSAQEKAADQAAAEAAADERVLLLEDLGYFMDARLGPMMRDASAFDAAVAASTAAEMAELAAQIPTAFSVDTRGFTLVTNARDSVWEDHQHFLEKQQELQAALADLQEIAAGGERPSTLQAIVKVGQACGSCHDAHRND